MLSNISDETLRYTFNEVRKTNNVGGDEFTYQGHKMTINDTLSHKQMAFCSIKENSFFVILIDGFDNNDDLKEATEILLKFWWTK